MERRELYAAGDFTMADRVAAQNVARWDGTAWSSVGAGLPGTVFSLAADVTGRVYAGGQVVFTVAAWNGEEWTVIGGSELGVYVGALLLDGNGNLYAGGAFASLAGVAANNVARWDGAAVTHVDHAGDLPASFRPSPAYPNPFNPETHFTLSLARPQRVSLQVIDVLGREVERLHSGPLPAGNHQFAWQAPGAGSGIYLIRAHGEQAAAATTTVILVR